MFINFLIVIFTVFIIYLLFSNNSIIEGKRNRRKLRSGKKGGLKMRNRKNKKSKNAVEANPDEEDEEAVEEENPLPTAEELPQMVSDLKNAFDTLAIKVDALAGDAAPRVSASAVADEDENDPGI
jgi:hypothetical protein